jgi:flagellin-like hook-associated protein FlgL
VFGLKNVSDAAYGTCAVSGTYNGLGVSEDHSGRMPGRESALVVIREFLADKTATVRQNPADAAAAVAAIQVLTDAIETIAEKLVKMLELAGKAAGLHRSQVQAEEMQNQFRNLARQINQIANNTEYELSKPFSGNGESFAIPVGDGSQIDIPARDFRMDVRQLDIETDPQGALSKVKEAIRDISHYKTHLDRQDARAREITAAIELQIQDAMGVEMQHFQPELAAPMADYAASLISQGKQASIDMQANLTCDEILKLLENKR